MRRLTATQIVQDLRVHAPTTRGEISRRTGISQALVGQVMERLIGRGLVSDSPEVRKDKTLRFPVNGPRFLGVEVERHHMVLATAGLGDELHGVMEIPAPFGPAYLADAEALARPLETALAADPAIDSIAISVRHTVDTQGMVRFESPTDAYRWIESPLPSLLSTRLGRPVLFVNKVKALSYGERRRQQRLAPRGYGTFLLVSLGTALGGTLVLGGQVVTGQSGFAGEIGAMRVSPHGVADDKGQTDTLENTLCAAGLLRRIRHLIYQGMECRMRADFLDESLSFHHRRFWDLLTGGWDEGDPAVRRAVSTAADLLGAALSPLEEFCDPEKIILTGPALLDEKVFKLVEASYARTMASRGYRRPAGLEYRPTQKTDIALGAVEPVKDAYLERWLVREYGG